MEGEQTSTQAMAVDIETILNNADGNQSHGVAAIDPSPDQVKYNSADYQRQLEYQKILKNLQGNILKGHDRDFAVHMFIRFSTNEKDSQKGQTILNMIKERVAKSSIYVTSAKRQLEETTL